MAGSQWGWTGRGRRRRRSSLSSWTPSTETPSRSGQWPRQPRSEEHTSELQSLAYLVCRLLLEKKKDECVEERIALVYIFRPELPLRQLAKSTRCDFRVIRQLVALVAHGHFLRLERQTPPCRLH